VLNVRPVATGVVRLPSGNLSEKQLWLDECLEVETRKVGITLAESLCVLRGKNFG
jgi:hypothetical protein